MENPGMLNNRKIYLKINTKNIMIKIFTPLLASTDCVGLTDNHACNFCWKPKETLIDHSPHFGLRCHAGA